MFLRNYWYVAAWGHEVGRQILARTICNEPMVLFRTADGTVAAIEDRCCHRQMPLSKGWLEGDSVRCGYHGLRFDAAGKCVEIPGQVNIPPRARVRTFPVAEKWKWVWVWTGDAEKADPALIPDMHWNDDPDWISTGSTTYVRGNYQLISDNLLDLTHETYIHRGSLGNQAVVEHPIKTVGDERSVTVTRWMYDHEPAPFWRKAIGVPDNCDRWQIVHFTPPANLVLDIGVAITGTGAPEGDRSRGVEARNLNCITPETENSTWYFWALARRFQKHDHALTERLKGAVADIFKEDTAAIEAQQQVIDRSAGRATIDVNADAGSIMARRMVANLLAEETAQRGDAALQRRA
jgi:phenylpropionate dioxygenase-like ring-hydroxylating dioxygenase large terminal subunit